jgi:hypothetical protein
MHSMVFLHPARLSHSFQSGLNQRSDFESRRNTSVLNVIKLFTAASYELSGATLLGKLLALYLQTLD